jgi:glycosyltransferase involved in cell wall biosynthesis
MTDSLPPSLGRLQRLYRRLPVGLRRRVGAQVTRAVAPHLSRALPAAEPGRDGAASSAVIVGLSRSTLGHGAAARLCAAELRQGGIAVSQLDVSAALRAPIAAEEPAAAADATAEAAVVVLNPEEMVQALQGAGGEALRGKRVAAYWVWELERAPARWRTLAGHVPHEIWAPSRFAADALAAVFDQPARVIPHPCALTPPPEPTSERRAAARSRLGFGPDDFLAFSSFSAASSLARKNPAGSIEAFGRAFAGRTDAKLVLRCGGGGAYPAAMTALRSAVRNAQAPVSLIEAASWEELLDLYAACDVYLSLHRSEGFGLNLAEAMLSARPVIATAWSGNLEFMDETSSALIPATLVPARDPQGIYRQRDARWAEPNLDAAVEQLRRLKTDVDARMRLGLLGRAAARERLSGGAAAQALRAPISRA